MMHDWKVLARNDLELPILWECSECGAVYGYSQELGDWGYLKGGEIDDATE